MQDVKKEKSSKRTDLRTFSSRSLSLQPALDACEAEKVSAAEGGKPVFPRSRPRLEADGAVVTFTLLPMQRWFRSCHRWDQLGGGHRGILNYRWKVSGLTPRFLHFTS